MPPRPTPITASLPPLPLGESAVPGLSRIIGLANNELAHAPSPAVQAACADAVGGINRYPDTIQADLRRKIAMRYGGLNPDRIVCSIGSSELIGLIAQAYSGPGTEVLIGRQGYLYFRIASLAAGATPVLIGSDTLGNRPGFDLGAALEAVTPATRIVFIDNPSNPLGTILSRAELHRFRAELREDILLVLDAAYGDFVTDPDYSAGDDLVEAGENTICLRTFSKIYGLAGLRVGWGHMPVAIAETIRRVMRPGNIATPSLAGALAALDEPDLIARRVAENAEIREDFTIALRSLPGVRVIPSNTNFVFTRFDPSAPTALFEAMKARGILLRPMAPYGQPDSLRITIGTAEEMAITIQALRELLD